jgi:hypothetical protein
METQAAAVFDGLVLDSIKTSRATKTGHIAVCHYVEPDVAEKQKLETGEIKFSWDTSGGTAHITTAHAQTAYGADAPDVGLAINADLQGQAKGVDIPVPALKFSITWRAPAANITWAYVRTVANMVGRYNDATFFDFPAGEVLFIGGPGSQGTKSDPELQFHFLHSENLAAFDVGTIEGIVKPGHAYLWTLWDEDTNAGRSVPTPLGVYVAEVHKPGNFADLGFGVSAA